MKDAVGHRGSVAAQCQSPARDARFAVVDRWEQMSNFPTDDPMRRIEFFHRQMNEEVDSLECSARNLTDFPEADWSLRICLARQCADEARHARMFRVRLEQMGGHVGQFPVLNFQYRIITAIETLIGRLTVQNRSFEAGGIDAIAAEIADCTRRDATIEGALFDAQMADEIVHVRFANEWINAALKSDAKLVMAVGRAMTSSAAQFKAIMGVGGTSGATYPTDRQGRLDAGFHESEVALAGAAAEKLRAETTSPLG